MNHEDSASRIAKSLEREREQIFSSSCQSLRILPGSLEHFPGSDEATLSLGFCCHSRLFEILHGSLQMIQCALSTHSLPAIQRLGLSILPKLQIDLNTTAAASRRRLRHHGQASNVIDVYAYSHDGCYLSCGISCRMS